MNWDVHCHADQLSPDEMERELKGRFVVGVASHYQSGQELLRLRRQYPGLRVCLGIHPEYPEYFHEADAVERQIRENIDDIAGIGEIGLPYFSLLHIEAPEKNIRYEKAVNIFERFLRLAGELSLPLNLHCVENTAPHAIMLLEKYGIKKALFHWFEGNASCLGKMREAGWNISVSPDLAYNRRYRTFVGQNAAEIADIFTLESDGPWEYAGKRGVPSMVEETASVLAEIVGARKEHILEKAERHTRHFLMKEAME